MFTRYPPIGNDIMTLPNEMIEEIVSNMDGKSIVKLVKIDSNFGKWLFKHKPSYYFDKLEILDIIYFTKINDAFEHWFRQKYIINVATDIIYAAEGDVFKFRNPGKYKLQILFEQDEQRLMISTDYKDGFEFAISFKKEGIYLRNFHDGGPTKFKYVFAMDLENDIQLFIELLFKYFGFVLKTPSTYCLVLICTTNNFLFRIG